MSELNQQDAELNAELNELYELYVSYLKIINKSYSAVFSIIEEKLSTGKETIIKSVDLMAKLNSKDYLNR